MPIVDLDAGAVSSTTSTTSTDGILVYSFLSNYNYSDNYSKNQNSHKIRSTKKWRPETNTERSKKIPAST